MNQILNIEEEFENYIYQLYQQYFSLEEKGLILYSTHSVTDSVNFEEIVVKHKEILHHQLQKARHDWLREEIVRLEGMKKDKEWVEKEWEYEDCSGTRGRWEDYAEHNQALQTIIDRYQDELDQDVTNKEPHYEMREGKPVWVKYEEGQEVVEPYRHQDGHYANMCAFPNYCRCSD